MAKHYQFMHCTNMVPDMSVTISLILVKLCTSLVLNKPMGQCRKTTQMRVIPSIPCECCALVYHIEFTELSLYHCPLTYWVVLKTERYHSITELTEGNLTKISVQSSYYDTTEDEKISSNSKSI